jgi:hypothetical protein
VLPFGVLRLRVGASTASLPPRLPLRRFVAFRSIDKRAACRIIWFSCCPPHSRWFTTESAVLRHAVPRSLSLAVHPPVRFTPLQSPPVPKPAPRLPTWSPSFGVAFPLRDISPQRPYPWVPSQKPCRSRRFSRPQRFPPPRTLWVYFTPQPRPGFALQGFPPSYSRAASSTSRALLSVG